MIVKSIAAGVLLALAGVSAAYAQQRNIEVILFGGTSSLPVYVAKDKGFFEREGVNVNITPTPNSGFQMSNLISGKFNIAGTAIDNLIAYMEGQGTAKVDREPDLITIMGLSSTELTIVAQPEYKSIADLKGKARKILKKENPTPRAPNLDFSDWLMDREKGIIPEMIAKCKTAKKRGDATADEARLKDAIAAFLAKWKP